MSWLFGAPEVNIEAPPPAPAAPGLTPQEEELLNLEYQLGLANYQTVLDQQTQDAAVRAELEALFGMPLSQLMAEQTFAQTGLFSSFQAAQQAELDRAEAERQAFIDATGMTPEDAQAQEAAYQIQIRGPLQARFLAGLSGTLPVSPALLRSLNEQETELRASLLEALGPGYETSSAGIQALADFSKRRAELETASREGAISEAEQFGFGLQPATERIRLARQGAMGGVGPQGSPLSAVLPFSQRNVYGSPSQFGDVRGGRAAQRAFEFAPMMAGYQGALGFNQGLNTAQYGAAGAQAQAAGNLWGGLLGSGGTLSAAYLTRPGGAWGA